MADKSPMINVFCSGLPSNVTRLLYQEYQNRRMEIERILAQPDNNYQLLKGYESTVESLLALSLFYRHVMGHMQGAVSFYSSVNKKTGKDKECAIKIGKTVLDSYQQRHILSAVIKFNQIQDKYQLTPIFFEYSETIQFLRNCRDLFYQKEYEEDDTV